jgi:NAD(P)-dependent dehydrogenase (short-subunit alcohol dehydrogenase family)
MNLQLRGLTAFVSGSTAGIGLSIAEALIKEEAAVIINGRNQKQVDEAVATFLKLFPNAKVSGIAADFGNKEEVEALIKQLPPIDILVNNVGIFKPIPFAEIPDEDWFHLFEVNVMSGVRLARHVFPQMLKRNWGRVIFISSESAVFIPDEMIHYGMTKTAQLAVARGMAELTKGTNVTVNTVLPGPTKSRGVDVFVNNLAEQENKSFEEMEEKFFHDFRPTSLLQRFATTEEIANMVAFLASPLASATNGAAIRVDGGLIKSIL